MEKAIFKWHDRSNTKLAWFRQGDTFMRRAVLGAVALLILIIGAMFFHLSLRKIADDPGCGQSVTEAIARGCTFDSLSDLWLPPKCSRKYQDEYLSFNEDRPWRYWADKEGHSEISNRSSYINGLVYYSNQEDHLVHCAFMIMRLADSMETGAPFGRDDRSTVTEHLSHCSQALLFAALQGPGLDAVSTKTRSGIGHC